MDRDDYSSFGSRGQRRGSENMDDRGWQQGGDWQRQQGRPGWYSQGGGGFGQGWPGPSGYGQGGYTQGGGGYAGGSGQQWAGERQGGQGREGPGMYGQGGGYGQSAFGQGGYGQGGYGQGGYGFGGGREFFAGPGQGRDYPQRDYGMETARDAWGGYGTSSGFSGQRAGPGFQRGQFSGRGPRGYRRADERICEDINEALTRHPELDATEIEVIVEGGEAILSGLVEERRDKRLAEDIAERVSGVNEVRNQLKPRKGLREKISELLTGGSDREGGRDREAAEAKSRSGRSTSSSTT